MRNAMRNNAKVQCERVQCEMQCEKCNAKLSLSVHTNQCRNERTRPKVHMGDVIAHDGEDKRENST